MFRFWSLPLPNLQQADDSGGGGGTADEGGSDEGGAGDDAGSSDGDGDEGRDRLHRLDKRNGELARRLKEQGSELEKLRAEKREREESQARESGELSKIVELKEADAAKATAERDEANAKLEKLQEGIRERDLLDWVALRAEIPPSERNRLEATFLLGKKRGKVSGDFDDLDKYGPKALKELAKLDAGLFEGVSDGDGPPPPTDTDSDTTRNARRQRSALSNEWKDTPWARQKPFGV